MTLDERMMRLALRHAAKGTPSPNPHVGAVVARGERVIATGFHRRAGEAHAEVVALARAGRAARGATLYVTLEPCNHFGRTGPCTDAILAAGVRRVVVGARDPAPHVPGAAAKLRRAGVVVELGVEEADAVRLVSDFAKHITTGLPHVTLKAALTLDGRMATRTGDSRWITGELARRHAHRLRAESDAVLVGVGTVLADDPSLTVRHVRGATPLRVVVDSHLRTPPSAKLLHIRGAKRPLLFHGPGATAARARALEKAGAELVEVRGGKRGVSLRAVLRELGRRDVVRLLCEGGATLHGAFLAGGLADRLAVFIAPRVLGDSEAVPFARGPRVSRLADALTLVAPRIRVFGDDVYVEGIVPSRAQSGSTRAISTRGRKHTISPGPR